MSYRGLNDYKDILVPQQIYSEQVSTVRAVLFDQTSHPVNLIKLKPVNGPKTADGERSSTSSHPILGLCKAPNKELWYMKKFCENKKIFDGQGKQIGTQK